MACRKGNAGCCGRKCAKERRVVVCAVGGVRFALPIGVVREIVRVERCGESAQGAGWSSCAVGTARVVDIAGRLGVTASSAGPESRMIVVEAHGALEAFVVDRVIGVADSADGADGGELLDIERLVSCCE